MAQATIDKEHNQNNPEVKPRRSKRAIIHRFIDRNRLNVGLTISTILQLLVLFFWYTPDLKFNSLDKFVDEVAFVDSVAITENTADTPTDKVKSVLPPGFLEVIDGFYQKVVK